MVRGFIASLRFHCAHATREEKSWEGMYTGHEEMGMYVLEATFAMLCDGAEIPVRVRSEWKVRMSE